MVTGDPIWCGQGFVPWEIGHYLIRKSNYMFTQIPTDLVSILYPNKPPHVDGSLLLASRRTSLKKNSRVSKSKHRQAVSGHETLSCVEGVGSLRSMQGSRRRPLLA